MDGWIDIQTYRQTCIEIKCHLTGASTMQTQDSKPKYRLNVTFKNICLVQGSDTHLGKYMSISKPQ